MSELPIRPSFLSYEHRPEYDGQRTVGLYTQALESFEELAQQSDELGLLSYAMRDGIVRRQLDVYQFDDGIRSEDEVLFSDFTTLQLQRAPMHSESQLIIEDYRTGPLRQMARLTLRDFVADSPYPFINEYQLETYSGGGAQALISTTNVIRGEGLDTRNMTPYDFQQLARQTTSTVYAMGLVSGVMMNGEER